jgi:polysaccharide biosynthesis/export protein
MTALALCATVARADEPARSAAPYLLQPGDVLQVSVWKEPELQSEVIIRPDGALSFPLAGDVPAAGRGVEQLRAELETRLRKLVPEATVSVAIKVIAGNRIYVLGKVARPGDYAINRPTDVMQALSLAGGATPFADINDIRILRRSGDHEIAFRFRYGDVERGRALEQNMLLQGGDTVVVP